MYSTPSGKPRRCWRGWFALRIEPTQRGKFPQASPDTHSVPGTIDHSELHRVWAFTALVSQIAAQGLPIHYATDQDGSTERYKRPSIILDKLLAHLSMTELHNGSVNNTPYLEDSEEKSARTSFTNEHVEIYTWENTIKFIEGQICLLALLKIPQHTSSSDRIREWSLITLLGNLRISIWNCILISCNKVILQLFSFHLIGFPQDQSEGMRCWWMIGDTLNVWEEGEVGGSMHSSKFTSRK